MTDRPAKRQRLNPFVDIEAEGEDSAEETEDVFEDNVSQEGADLDVSSLTLQHTMHSAQHVEQWDSFLSRASNRGRNLEIALSGKERLPSSEDFLWEIGCAIGSEELVAFKVLSRATHPTHPQILAKSIFARSTLPGHVYAEVSTLTQAINLAAVIQELNANRVRLVPAEDMLARLQVPNPYSFQPQSWARVRGTGKGWGVYRGDVVLVAEVNDQPSVVVVPRISDYTTKSRTRPGPALRPPFALRAVFGSEFVSDVANEQLVTFRGQSFTPEGFIVSPLSGVDLMRPQDDLPSKELLDIFRQCPSLLEDTYLKATASLSSLQINAGDWVKVIRGDYRGIFGRVTRVDEKAVAVYMESQGFEEEILVDSVRRVFRIGDQVKILRGTHEGSTGWVVDVLQGFVKVLNIEKSFEISVPTADIEFFSPPFVLTLRRRTQRNISGLKGEDPNKIFIGKRIMVVGRHQYKSYKGTIKVTNPAGDAWVELDALQQKIVQLTLCDLALLGKGELHVRVIDPVKQVQRVVRVAPEPVPSVPSQAMCSTPLHEEAQTDVSTPAWDPNSTTPTHEQDQTDVSLMFTSRGHWLDKLVGTRVKLFEHSAPTKILEFEAIVGDSAKVRDGTRKRLITLDGLCPLPPTESDDLVTPKVGEMSGTMLKVRKFSSEMCSLRIPGKPLRKNEKDFVLPTETLVQIYPPFR